MNQQPAAPQTYALIPAKSFARGKSRLRDVLGDEARTTLTRTLFTHVLRLTRRSNALAGTLIATDGDDVAELAQRSGAQVLRDCPQASERLDLIIDRALAQLRTRGIERALVLMSDLPHLHEDDLHRLLTALDAHSLVIAPDQSGSCTNALGLRLDTSYQTAFGDPRSYQRHLERARRADLSIAQISSPTLAFDLDTQADLEALRRGTWPSWG